MIRHATDNFESTWEDPADAEQSWMWDEMHTPRLLVPMGQDFYAAFNRVTFGIRSVVANGYSFRGITGSFPEPPPDEPEMTATQRWKRIYEPIAARYANRIRRRDYASMSDAALAGSLDAVIEEAAQCLLATMTPVFQLSMEAVAFIDFCTEHFGSDGETLAATIMQGVPNESAEAGMGLVALADEAAQAPELAAAIRDGRYDAIATAAGGQEFGAAFDRFLDDYGWRAESWSDLHVQTWAEDRSVPLGMIARYLSNPANTPRDAQRRAAEQRAVALREVDEQLSNETARREFDSLLAVVEGYVPTREGRAHWQLSVAGVARIPVLELGRRMVDRGLLAQPDDALYLHVAELQALERGALDDAIALVAQRRADYRRYLTLTPPPFLGPPPPPPPPMFAQMRMFAPPPPVDATDEPGASTDQVVLSGVGASAGVVTAVARVIAGLDEAGRLGAGEVLVCRSTAAPWTPLFAVAGAVVTNTGGLLSHSAIVAREYAIPCVVGTRTAVDDIPDGATVTVDGGSGTVTVVSTPEA